MKIVELDTPIKNLANKLQPMWFEPPMSEKLAEETGMPESEGVPFTIRRAIVSVLCVQDEKNNVETQNNNFAIAERFSEIYHEEDEIEVTYKELKAIEKATDAYKKLPVMVRGIVNRAIEAARSSDADTPTEEG